MAEITPREPYENGYTYIEIREPPALYRITLSEHGWRDLEFVLAQRRAMSRRCGDTEGEHTCALYLGHVDTHVCRGCNRTWQDVTGLPDGARHGRH
jgi:hypothetical protein